MNTFPTTIRKPVFPINVEEIFPSTHDDFQANYVQIIKKANRSRRLWTFVWADEFIISATDFTLIRDFWLANKNSWFYLIHPYTSVTYEAGFSGNLKYAEELIADNPMDEYSTQEIFYSLTIEFMEK